MDLYQAFYQHLSSKTPLQTLLNYTGKGGTTSKFALYPDQAADDHPATYVIQMRIDEDPEYAHDGQLTCSTSFWVFDIYGPTKESVSDVKDAINNEISGYHGDMQGLYIDYCRIDGLSSTPPPPTDGKGYGKFHDQLDYEIRHAVPAPVRS